MLDPFFDVDERRPLFLLLGRLTTPALQILPEILHQRQLLGDFLLLRTGMHGESAKFPRVLSLVADVVYFSE